LGFYKLKSSGSLAEIIYLIQKLVFNMNDLHGINVVFAFQRFQGA
jgi:hypothetical protein